MARLEGTRMIGYHVTTPMKLGRYIATGAILPPVRFWAFENSAREWAKKTKRTIILKIDVPYPYPMPDHKPTGHAWWTDQLVRSWEIDLAQNPRTIPPGAIGEKPCSPRSR